MPLQCEAKSAFNFLSRFELYPIWSPSILETNLIRNLINENSQIIYMKG